MFDSGIKALDLIEQIKNEADISTPIPDEDYILWINTLEQMLYSEVIKEQAKIEVNDINADSSIDIENHPVNEEQSSIRFEDIHAIYNGETQLIKTTVASGGIFPDCFYKIENKIGLNLKNEPEKIRIVYYVRPAIKKPENISDLNVMLPVEFIDLAKSKLRGEAYKLANEGDIAAMWLNDYNILLETFKVWVSDKEPKFGV